MRIAEGRIFDLAASPNIAVALADGDAVKDGDVAADRRLLIDHEAVAVDDAESRPDRGLPRQIDHRPGGGPAMKESRYWEEHDAPSRSVRRLAQSKCEDGPKSPLEQGRTEQQGGAETPIVTEEIGANAGLQVRNACEASVHRNHTERWGACSNASARA